MPKSNSKFTKTDIRMYVYAQTCIQNYKRDGAYKEIIIYFVYLCMYIFLYIHSKVIAYTKVLIWSRGNIWNIFSAKKLK